MIRVSELRLELDEDESLLRKKAGKVLRTDPKYIEKLTIFKKSVDARKKDDVHFSYTVDVTLGLDETQVLRRCRSPKAKAAEEYKYTLPVNRRQSAFRPVVVGFGPAGMFAGLILAEAGLRPIVLERGKDIQRRQQDVNAFWQQHILNEESNVQFGEGGAGTFSDGKLTTGIKSPFIRQVLQELYEAGAPEEILYAAKPHIGTDRLAVVVQNIRKKIERLGGEVRLECRLENLILANGFIHGVTYSHLGQTKCFIKTARKLSKSPLVWAPALSTPKSSLTRPSTVLLPVTLSWGLRITSSAATVCTSEGRIPFVCARGARWWPPPAKRAA